MFPFYLFILLFIYVPIVSVVCTRVFAVFAANSNFVFLGEINF